MKQIFFSEIGVPQLLAPLHLIFCGASLCQDYSSESSPIMRDEVGEHMAWDPRPFLHTVSLQILQIQFLSFPTEAVRFSFNICWYLMESMIPCILTRCPGPLEAKQPTTSKIRHHTSQWVWGR